MLDGAQEYVAFHQHAVLIRAQESAFGQPRQAIQGVAAAHLGMFASVYQLEVLGDEFDVADGAFAQFDLAPIPAALAELGLGALLHGVDVGAHGFVAVAELQRRGPLEERVAHPGAARDHARLEQRLFFPQPGVLAQIGQVTVERRHQRADLSPRAQPHVNPIEEALARGLGERLDELLAQPLVDVDVPLCDEKEVDIGAVVQLAPAQLAQRQHGEPVGVNAQPVRGEVKADAHDAFRQAGELAGHRRQVQQPAQVAQADAQQLPMLEVAEAIQRGRRGRLSVVGFVVRGHRAAGRGQERLQPVFGGDFGPLGQQRKVIRVAQQDLGEELAARKQGDEQFERARVSDELAETLDLIGYAPRPAPEVDERVIGVGRVGQRQDQVGQQLGEDSVRGRGSPDAAQPLVRGAPVGEPNGRQQAPLFLVGVRPAQEQISVGIVGFGNHRSCILRPGNRAPAPIPPRTASHRGPPIGSPDRRGGTRCTVVGRSAASGA